MRIKGTAARGRRADLRRTAGAALLGMAAASAALGQPLPPNLYADLSLEELANVVITSVARRPQALAGAAASVFLITGEELRRSGVVTVPEALRLAPNLQVAALNAHEYAITTRGFTSSIANKLLVMIDGRTVYSPLFSGVFWDAQDLVIDDIDRIEVISGPGGATWGTNAVNGVINIVTRGAADTQGVLAKATAGAEERSVAVRHGFALGAQTHARIYAKHYAHDATALVAGGTAADGWKRAQAGFRIDGGTAAGRYTLQGDLYRGRSDDRPTFGALKSSGANLLGRWSQRLSENADFDIQGYYDRADRTDNFLLQERVQLFDLEAKGRFVSGAHRWLVGAGHRRATAH